MAKTFSMLFAAVLLAAAPTLAYSATTLAGGKNTRMHGMHGKSSKMMMKSHHMKSMKKM